MNDEETLKNRPVSPLNGQPVPIGHPFVAGDSRAVDAQKKAVAARNKRKTLREELLALLSSDIVDRKGRTVHAQTAMSNALLKEALSGNTKAFEIIRDTIGEKPVDRVMIADIEQDVIDEVENAVNTKSKESDWFNVGEGVNSGDTQTGN